VIWRTELVDANVLLERILEEAAVRFLVTNSKKQRHLDEIKRLSLAIA
jgi:hypothetical protein